ncbi:nitroreductase family protein [Taibaiella chishuiensis]|uniref:Nitroreductase n=1 Tax=Taibaiella chishuiensis TaxID=1434707 RepID=A0A2P8D2Q5_9BACT|nr:nitroreductase family protein [Taibaiella chishuiensis]PSK91456.1 nitroreductase [Taibaiella chishuiensis]
MIALIKKAVPRSVKTFYRHQKSLLAIVKDFCYDYKRYRKHYASIHLKTKDNLQAFLIKEYHAVEKGMALRNARQGFGVERITRLIRETEHYINCYGYDSTTDITLKTLKEYCAFDARSNTKANPVIPMIEKLLAKTEILDHVNNGGGTKEIRKTDIDNSIHFDYSRFVRSRFSTRDFTDIPVDTALVMEALDDARFTPSVCNRQAWKAYVVDHSNPELKQKFLGVQNGNRGFGEYISTLIVITGKLSAFFDYERNQVFIDGGMFAMSVVMALHARGLGTCCLNTSYTAKKNEAFNKVMDLDSDCVPIMFIAVGNLKEQYKVAVSARKPLAEIATVL